ncbi:hypothetical protein [Candidatus Poriferisodalis sp.]|uniref:hypothetical protein n=1 Tax=Candidatus Poriferisodalis sp. TaxID=3101277 RepID=UPI003B02B852
MASSDGSAYPSFRALFADGEPIRVKDLAEAAAVPAPEDDKPKKNSQRVLLNKEQLIFGVAAMSGTHKLAGELQRMIEECRTENRGRKKRYGGLDAILFLCSTYLYGGAQGVHLKNRPQRGGGSSPRLVDQINESLQESRPGDPGWRLDPSGFTRDQHRRLREDYLCDEVLDELERTTRAFCVEAALRIGQFNPSAGTYTQPDTTQLVAGDGTKVGGLYDNADPNKLNNRTGSAARCDTEAFTPESRKSGTTPPPPHYEWEILITRSEHPNERIPLAIFLKGEAQRGKSDATYTVDLIKLLLEEHPDLIRGLFGCCYDGALSADDKERLLKMGIQPVSKLRRPIATVPVLHNIGAYEFAFATKHKNGKTNRTVVLTTDIITVDGTPTVLMTDGNGNDVHVPLVCVNRRRRKQRSGTYAVTNEYALPDHPIVPARIQGATTTIRMDTTASALNGKHPVLMPHLISSFPASDPMYRPLYGVRQDCESGNRKLKGLLRDKRSITATRNNNRYQAIGYQLLVTANALIAYQERTGDNLSDIFGQRFAETPQSAETAPLRLVA